MSMCPCMCIAKTEINEERMNTLHEEQMFRVVVPFVSVLSIKTGPRLPCVLCVSARRT